VITVLLIQCKTPKTRFYRVEVSYNLFGEYSVLREWGPSGAKGRQLLYWFANLREACLAADRWQKQAIKRGYNLEGHRT
jgi:predicted DNA-binding WGR domain protein